MDQSLCKHYPLFLPPPSTPRATGHSPAHTTAADPLEEPPVILLVSCGFRVVLKMEIQIHIQNLAFLKSIIQ